MYFHCHPQQIIGLYLQQKKNRGKPKKKIISITDHASPKNTKEVHRLTSAAPALCGTTHMLNEMLNAKIPSNY